MRNIFKGNVRFIIAVVVAVMAVESVGLASNVFKDVDNANVFHNDISWLAENGITLGCNPPANDKFCPQDNITRQQMAAMLHRYATNVPQPGISGYQITTRHYDFDGEFGSGVGVCDAPQVVVGGGAQMTGVWITFLDSYPSTQLQWRVRARNPDWSTTPTAGFDVYAICVDA